MYANQLVSEFQSAAVTATRVVFATIAAAVVGWYRYYNELAVRANGCGGHRISKQSALIMALYT